MLKIYVNDDETSFGRHSYIVISDDNLSNGCWIKHPDDRLGYSSYWDRGFFRPLNKGEVIDFNVDSSGYLKFFDNKLFSYRDSSDREQCVIDLKKGTIELVRIDKYLESFKKPTIKLINNSKNKFDIFVLNSTYRITKRYWDCEWSGDFIISKSSDDPFSVKGCRINNTNIIGYHSNWDPSVFTKISNVVSFPLDHSCMELRGSNLLIEGNDIGDCVIDLKKGTINEIELDNYKSKNPLIIKLKNKSC